MKRATAIVGRWSMVDGRWSMVDGRWSMVDGRWSMADGEDEGVRNFFSYYELEKIWIEEVKI